MSQTTTLEMPPSTPMQTTPTQTTQAPSAHPDLVQLAGAVRRAQRGLGSADGAARDAVLLRVAAQLDARRAQILDANARDLADAEASDLAAPLLRRLALSDAKIDTLRDGVLQLAAADDPVGKVVRHTLLDDGLDLRQVQSPLGVLLVIFESRPDAVIQIASLALRAGAGVILKGGAEATASNRALVACLRAALEDEGQAPDAVALVEGRRAVGELLAMDSLIDLVIPRGSGELVKTIQASTKIPVLGHAEGVCHLYLDAAADPAMAAALAVDGKCDYPAACNATETLLVHEGFLPHLPQVAEALVTAGVTLRTCPRAFAALSDVGKDVANGSAGAVELIDDDSASPGSKDAWHTEYGDLVLSVRVVPGLDDAVDHIHAYGSGHTDAIVTADEAVAEAFLRRVDAASVFWNASTRFADGYRYGLGAEVGIATGRIHARGPVGVDGLLTTRWLLVGAGQGAADYGPGKKSFLHRDLT